ncbi:hypothetical protein ILYODFUR_014767 [Ilyodon furcidens]|uniref:Uncharacterized protein n=1 Tax=Ilyodon furcidens TaxID=33524 RepID=A0ABV0SNQ3_9TELE
MTVLSGNTYIDSTGPMSHIHTGYKCMYVSLSVAAFTLFRELTKATLERKQIGNCSVFLAHNGWLCNCLKVPSSVKEQLTDYGPSVCLCLPLDCLHIRLSKPI